MNINNTFSLLHFKILLRPTLDHDTLTQQYVLFEGGQGDCQCPLQLHILYTYVFKKQMHIEPYIAGKKYSAVNCI